jgi:MFS family permease
VDRNVKLYPWYQAARSANFSLPIFFLYFAAVLSPAEAVALEATYFFAVVVLEVPSGYLSDRVGRRLTLQLAMGLGVLSAILFVTGASFAVFALAQVLKAAANAFNSGTDSALLFDSLTELGREHEIGEHEARGQGAAFAAAAGASAVGGLVAGLDLRFAYVLVGLAEVAALVFAWRFLEPARGRATPPLGPALRQVVARVRQPALLWVFALAVGMIVLNHVPYEFFQPYVDLLFGELRPGGFGVSPAVAGGVAAVMMLLGYGATRVAMPLRARLGAHVAMLLCGAIQLAIIGAMTLALSPWVLLAIVLRSAPMGVLWPVAHAEIHPRVETEIRASYLSVQSLAGRLAFSACLALSSRALTGVDLSHAVLAGVLVAFFVGGALLLAALVVASWGLRREA